MTYASRDPKARLLLVLGFVDYFGSLHGFLGEQDMYWTPYANGEEVRYFPYLGSVQYNDCRRLHSF
jgi:hypothetical protein